MGKLFKETSKTDERWIWAPAAHEYFSESCFFYLVRATARDQGGSLSSFVDRLLTAEGLPGQTVHGLFGFHDFLVRIWSDEAGRRRFLRALQQSSLDIEDISEFRVEDVRYEFASAPVATTYEVQESENLIRRVVESEASDDAVDANDLALLESDGILIKVPPAVGIRVYILLESNSSRLYRAAVDDEMAMIAASIRSQALQNCSVYFGVGRLTYIVKVVAESFEDLFKELRPLYDVAAELGFRSTTLPVPEETQNYIADSLRLDHAGPEIDRLVDALPLDDARRIVESMSTTERDRLLATFRTVRSRFAGGAFYDRALQIVGAVVAQNEDDLAAGLSFLTQLENRLSKVLFRVFADVMGPDWKRIIELAVAPELDPQRHWTLRTLFDAYRYGVDNVDGFSTEVASIVRPDLVKSFRSVLDVRNAYAHGTIYGEMSSVGMSHAVADLLDTFMDAAELFVSLDEAARKGRG